MPPGTGRGTPPIPSRHSGDKPPRNTPVWSDMCWSGNFGSTSKGKPPSSLPPFGGPTVSARHSGGGPTVSARHSGDKSPHNTPLCRARSTTLCNHFSTEALVGPSITTLCASLHSRLRERNFKRTWSLSLSWVNVAQVSSPKSALRSKGVVNTAYTMAVPGFARFSGSLCRQGDATPQHHTGTSPPRPGPPPTLPLSNVLPSRLPAPPGVPGKLTLDFWTTDSRVTRLLGHRFAYDSTSGPPIRA